MRGHSSTLVDIDTHRCHIIAAGSLFQTSGGAGSMDLIYQRVSTTLRLARGAPHGQGRRINWLNVTTVVSAAILIGAEVFGAAFAGSWAIATLFDLGSFGAGARRRVRALRPCRHGAVHPRRAPHRAVHHSRVSACRRSPKELRKSFSRDVPFSCTTRKNVISVVPNFARACGRVSVGR